MLEITPLALVMPANTYILIEEINVLGMKSGAANSRRIPQNDGKRRLTEYLHPSVISGSTGKSIAH